MGKRGTLPGETIAGGLLVRGTTHESLYICSRLSSLTIQVCQSSRPRSQQSQQRNCQHNVDWKSVDTSRKNRIWEKNKLDFFVGQFFSGPNKGMLNKGMKQGTVKL